MAQAAKRSVEEKAMSLAAPLVSAEGMELIEVEWVKERAGWVLRLYIDKAGGVGLDDCVQVSHAVETTLDVEEVVPHAYHLEVSSPGLERPLRKPEHFARAKGQKIKVKTFGPIGTPPRRNFSGLLEQVNEEAITVQVEGAGAFAIPFRDIAKAHLEAEL